MKTEPNKNKKPIQSNRTELDNDSKFWSLGLSLVWKIRVGLNEEDLIKLENVYFQTEASFRG